MTLPTVTIAKIIIHLDSKMSPFQQYIYEHVANDIHMYQSPVQRIIFNVPMYHSSTIFLGKVDNSILDFFTNVGCPIKKHPAQWMHYFIISDDTMFSLKLRGTFKDDLLTIINNDRT